MGSARLGSQNTTPAAICTNRSKRQNVLATNKTNPSPSLTHNNGNKKDGTETVWSTTQERGQAIIRTGRSSTKRPPHITTISTTRNNNSGILSGTTSSSSHSTRSHSTRSSSHCSRTRTGTTTTTTTNTTNTSSSTTTTAVLPLLPPPPPAPPLLTLTLSLLASPPPSPLHITNPATDDTSPPSAPLTTIRPRLRSCSPPLRLAARRPPLKLRDQNVAPVLAPALKENKKMGYETSPNPSATTNTRTQMPSLSATAARGINRPPLTPKIASASRQSQPQTPGLAAANTITTTPLPRRTQKRPSTITTTSSSNNRVTYDDSDTVSVAAFSPHLSSNVTPRSGSRQSRVDSANSTPNGTPSHDRPDRPDPWDSKPGFPFSSPFGQGDLSRRPMVTFSAVSPESNTPLRQDNSNARDAKFFHASDAKPGRPMSASVLASPNNSTFFYANGNGIKPKSSSPATLSPPLSPGLNRSQENVSSKFMYANGTPELRPTPPPIVSRGSGSTVSTASKVPAVRSAVASQRPVSPSKLPLHSPSYRHSIGSQSTNSSAAAVPAARVQVSPPPPLVPSAPGLRRSGTATSRSSGHSRSGSLARADAICEPLNPMTSPTTSLFPPINLSPTNPPPLTLASIIQAAEEFAEHENDGPPDDQAVLQSPTKSTVSSTDPVTELIANARRERKVQDLQIRNASLEAINRTLERQLRKQTAELRRHRRLSRASHLSLASTTISSRVPSGALSELEMKSVGLSVLSEEQLSTEELEEESFSDTDSVSSGVSPSILAEHDAKYRHRDEERLTLDLSKHQQILVDSQKINQSIKRCIDWTEELINDGKKALAYKVRVSDIQLGGRVLDPLDEEDENSRLPPSDDTIALDVKPIEEVSETSTSWGIEPQDRDSGIELPKDGG
ncbi:hypothetical protein F4782DRAFT_517312 [Xylaria castorea]|nr:hypothetical protein F4782DRAFT_517312 [Xylaria castorea]